MDVDTLLTRQMELHTTTRRPPKNADQLMELRDTLIEYKRFFNKLEDLTAELGSDRGTVFQCLMHISVGGAVKFDAQAQNGAMPMHQAKVLARWTAIELEPLIRESVPPTELMVYVGLSKDLRNTLRVKVEDENDLNTVQKTVDDSVEYLDFIYKHSGGDRDKMFDFYMVEDGPSLLNMLNGVDPVVISQDSTPSVSLNGSQRVPSSLLVQEWNPKVPLPTLGNFVVEIKQYVQVAANIRTHASERVVALQTVHDWLGQLADEHFQQLFLEIRSILEEPLSRLCCDKRSSLCRIACDALILVSQRATSLGCVTLISGNAERYSEMLRTWTSSLLKGIYVTITAISASTDNAMRNLILINNGHIAIVETVLTALEQKKQTELRRKCLGYLALSVATAEAHTIGGGNAFSSLLIPIAETYVEIGDSPSRKMARALCAVLRGVTMCKVTIANSKVDQLIEKELEQLKPSFASPKLLDTKLFEAVDFVSSINSEMSGLILPEHSLVSSNFGTQPQQRRAAPCSFANKNAEHLRGSNSNWHAELITKPRAEAPRRGSRTSSQHVTPPGSGTFRGSSGLSTPQESELNSGPSRRLRLSSLHKSPGPHSRRKSQDTVNQPAQPIIARISKQSPMHKKNFDFQLCLKEEQMITEDEHEAQAI
eukprot:gene5997-4302_t